jgi:hypothetical protein
MLYSETMQKSLINILSVMALAATSFAEKTHQCKVQASDLAAERRIMERVLSEPNIKPEEVMSQLMLSRYELGKFDASVGEEILTAKSYPLPNSDLKVSVAIFYTDERIPSADSVSLALLIGPKAEENPLEAIGASVMETNLENDTFILQVRQDIKLKGVTWRVSMQCFCSTLEERKKLLLKRDEDEKKLREKEPGKK